MTYKAQLRIPTETYAYIEVSVEGTPQDIVSAYREFTELVRPKVGITDKEFNAFIDRMLCGESNHVEEYQKMSDKQKDVVQTLKRALKRIEPKQ